MPYYLDGTPIRAPHDFKEEITNQYAQNRTLDGSINRDYFGDLKRVWTLQFVNMKLSDYTTVRTIYDSYLASFAAKTWLVDETNYTVSQTSVHLNMDSREFSIRGSDYLSDVTLTLTEA